MKITRDNYEACFLDYCEGNLLEDQTDQFLDFLMQNPDLKEELELFENRSLPQEEIFFADKKLLYRKGDEVETGSGNRVIAYLESDLDSKEQSIFEEEMTIHPELKKEYGLYRKTRLKPDTQIIYPNKRNLYRKPDSVIWMRWVARIAALVLLVVGIGSLVRRENPLKQQMSNQELAEILPEPVLSAEKINANQLNLKVDTGIIRKPVKQADTMTLRDIQNHSEIKPEKDLAENNIEPEQVALTSIPSKRSHLERISIENQLAKPMSAGVQKIYSEPEVLTLEEFLAEKAIQVRSEGFLSAQRIARAGLGVASGLSGERVGYVEKNGRIERIGFESKLFAFSIPIQKR